MPLVIKEKKFSLLLGAVSLMAVVGISCSVLAAEADKTEPSTVAKEETDPGYAAIVNGKKISWQEYYAAERRLYREKFYHGAISDDKKAEFRKEVIEDLVLHYVLVAEAKKRGIKPNEELVDRRLAKIEARNQGNKELMDRWAEIKSKLREQMLDNTRVSNLEEAIRNSGATDEKTLRKYYDDNKDLFTEPLKQHVQLILLGVDPSSMVEVWNAAKEEADRIYQKVNSGEDFAALAKLHSSDASSEDGGDMGYLHLGMLAPNAQAAVDKLQVGEVTKPVELLQGYAILKLLDRSEPVRRPYETVKDRVKALYVRDTGGKAWEKLIADLKSASSVEVDTLFEAAGDPAPEDTKSK